MWWTPPGRIKLQQAINALKHFCYNNFIDCDVGVIIEQFWSATHNLIKTFTLAETENNENNSYKLSRVSQAPRV